ncbi:MAG: ABC transporter substrate-binding protein, partial [Dehalococcoidia bacterium]
ISQNDVYQGPQDAVNTFIAFTMNVEKPPWDNPDIRKAAMYAINRQQFIEIVYRGDAKPNGLVNWGTGAFALPEDELDELQPFDPERSKQLIQDAGFDLPLKVKVMFPGNSTIEEHDQHLPVWLEQMKAAGFDVQQDAQDFGTWLDNYTNKNYDASLALNQVYETPEIPLDFQHSKGPAGSNIYSNGLEDPEVDAAIEATKKITDTQELVDAIHEVQRMIYAKGPMFLPIVSPFSRTLYWDFVKNLPTGRGTADLLLRPYMWLDI